MTDSACPLCTSVETRFFAHVTDRLLETTGETFSLLECRFCEILFLAPPPSEDDLKRYYPSGYWWSEPGAQQGLLGRFSKSLESIYRRAVLSDHVRFLTNAIRNAPASEGRVTLLDVGCSGGTLLHELSRRGISVRGLDVSEEAVAHASQVYHLDCAVGDLTSSPWRSEKFSVLSAFHVLEHVPNPRGFLESAHESLVEKGRLVLQVPNLRSWQFHVFGPRWYGLDPPRHLINFTEQALVKLLKETGFHLVREKRFSLRDDAAAWVSSLFPRLDPMARMSRRARKGSTVAGSTVLGIFWNFVYFLLLFLAIPIALCDSLWGRGATLMVEAERC
jgi:2-polyprenyl-3-methyl-5-hydroxy-6-metoxy-1,4-benzoquinol methylase